MFSVMAKRIAKMLLMYVLSNFVCDASLLTVPRSSVAVNGDKVELKCSSNSDKQVVWAFAPSNTSTDVEISFDDDIISLFRSRYKINKSISGQHNLIINSVDVQHAGKYACFHFDTGNKAIAYLTVLDFSPECSANTSSAADEGIMENGYLWMWCRIIHTGSMIPIFSWTKHSTEDAILLNTSTSNNRTVPMTTTSLANRQLYSDDNGVTFKCNIRFRLPDNSEENAPEYEYMWNYTANVLYGPRNLSIVRDAGRLECSADGNPTPTYRWTRVGTATSIEEPVLKLNGLYEKETTFQCTATNIFFSETKNITIQGSTSDPGTSRRTVAAAAVGGGSLLLLLVMITVSCFVRRRKLKGLTKIRVSFIGRSVSVEPDIIDVDIYSYGDIVVNRQPPSEHEQNGPNGRDSGCIPVYAEVKKGNGQEERERTRTNCSAPVYADVKMKKKAKESLSSNSTTAFDLSDDNSPAPQVSIQKKKRQNRVGADGTEYLDINEVRQPFNMSTARAATQPAFNRTNYAFIDHTLRVPPPPPKF